MPACQLSLACCRPLQGQEMRQQVLLLGYSDGFQVWDLEDERLVRELASRRDGAIR